MEMKNRIILFLLTILLLSCRQKFFLSGTDEIKPVQYTEKGIIYRHEIQDYETIDNLRNSSIIPGDNDKVFIKENKALSSDPADPPVGYSVQWVLDGTGSGDAGDVMMKINVGGTVKIITLVDFSAY